MFERQGLGCKLNLLRRLSSMSVQNAWGRTLLRTRASGIGNTPKLVVEILKLIRSPRIHPQTPVNFLEFWHCNGNVVRL